MKVYVLECGWDMVGVFSSKVKAKEYAKKNNNDYYEDGDYEIIEYDLDPNGRLNNE